MARQDSQVFIEIIGISSATVVKPQRLQVEYVDPQIYIHAYIQLTFHPEIKGTVKMYVCMYMFRHAHL